MDFALTPEQDAVTRLCARFDDAYWLRADQEGRFPVELHQALAGDGWLGICMPPEYGGAGMSGASAVHMNIFGRLMVMQACQAAVTTHGGHADLRATPGSTTWSATCGRS